MNSQAQQALTQKQQELGARFLRRSLGDARHILDNLQVSEVLSQPQTLTDLHALAHRLVGTAATLGFHALSDHAAELETQLAAIATAATPDLTSLQSIAARVLDEINRLARDRAIV